MRPFAALAAVLLAACSEPPEAPQVAGAAATVEFMRGADWPSYNRDLAGTRFSPLRQISPTNVDELRQAWSYPLGPTESGTLEGSELTPLVVDGILYATAADRVIALRADTGAEVWRFALPQGMPSQRGLAYWPGDAAVAARIFFTAGRTLVALDAATGQKAVAFGNAGEVPMPSAYNGAPTLFEDLLIVGSNGPPGGVRAYDARRGEERWRFVGAPTVLHPASSLTVDIDRALVYAVFAGPEPDVFYGGERGDDADPYLNSVVALDARTGNRRWHFQTVHHDIWDYDLAAPPALLDAAIEGARRADPRVGRPGRLPLHPRSRDRRAAVRHRRGTGAGVGRPRRACVADAARTAETAADRARRLRGRRHRDCRGHDGRARGVLPRVARSQRRLTERRAVHSVSSPRARQGAAFDDRVSGLARRRELGRRRRRSGSRSRLRQHEQRGRHRLAGAEHGRRDVGADGARCARGAHAIPAHERGRRAARALLVARRTGRLGGQ